MAIGILAVGAGRAQDCAAPVIDAPLAGPVRALERVTDYEIVLQGCARAESPVARIAIRTMRVEAEDLLLLVDPQSLATHLERAACWICGAPGPEMSNSRYLRAVETFARDKGKKLPPGTSWLENAGLTHGRDKAGVFVTGDLCPSRKPLDRAFLKDVEKEGAAPTALSVTGSWILRHKEDFLWLRRENAEGRLKILWVNHSFRHPFKLGLSNDENFILTPDIEPEAEILNVERLLIANGETPSVFFRYPGLISNSQWASRLRDAHLIPLGADSWLALGQKPGPGGVILVHPNGNEPAGLSAFETLNHSGALPKPLRNLTDAP